MYSHTTCNCTKFYDASDMAESAADNAAQPALATLARTMAETQAAEVETMTDMLAARGGTPLPAP